MTNAVIAFIDRSRPASNIFLADLRGGEPVCLNNTNKAAGVQLNGPDEVYYLTAVSPYQLWKINSTGAGERRVFTNAYNTFPIGARSPKTVAASTSLPAARRGTA